MLSLPIPPTTSTFMTWHARLGHAHSSAVKTVLQLCNVPYINKTVSDFCSACCLGKAHQLHASASTTVHFDAFELIYIDLWGPAPLFPPMVILTMSLLLMPTLVLLGFISLNRNQMLSQPLNNSIN